MQITEKKNQMAGKDCGKQQQLQGSNLDYRPKTHTEIAQWR